MSSVKGRSKSSRRRIALILAEREISETSELTKLHQVNCNASKIGSDETQHVIRGVFSEQETSVSLDFLQQNIGDKLNGT